VALIGASSSGKTTLAKKHFKPTEILSSDFFRALVSDDENDQRASAAAFEALYFVANKRLSLGLLTVIDATNLQKMARDQVLGLAKGQDCLTVGIVLNLPENVLKARNLARTDRVLDPKTIANQCSLLNRSLKFLDRDGFPRFYVLNSEEEVNDLQIVRVPLWNDKKAETGPFDVIGDVHGCYDELTDLLEKLGYAVDRDNFIATPPLGRRAIFLGDLVDRGPKNVETLRLVMGLTDRGEALCVPGNHDVKLLKYLQNKKVKLTPSLTKTVEALNAETPNFIAAVKRFLDSLVSHYVLDSGRLVVAHAGLEEKYQGRSSSRVRDFCLYGETNGELDEYGYHKRLPWADDYRGRALVVYGHTAMVEPLVVNNVICVDTGCAFGGSLTAFRYPEREFVKVKAKKVYYASRKPLAAAATRDDDESVLKVEGLLGNLRLETRVCRIVKIKSENSAAALEAMSRFAVDPRWLIYLPPTMSPTTVSDREDYLEYPDQAFEYYKKRNIFNVVCERKHMGSRAVIVLGRDEISVQKRFGLKNDGQGIVYTRTGRRFFEDLTVEKALLSRLSATLTKSGFWEDCVTDWVCLDAEIMPWSAKAQKLLVTQYAIVGLAGRLGLTQAIEAIGRSIQTLGGSEPLENLLNERQQSFLALEKYAEAYRAYCWEVNSVDDYSVAPFHVLATEGLAWVSRPHAFHLETIKKYLADYDPLFLATDHLFVDLNDPCCQAAASSWWEELTQSGGEGMVIKPLDFIAKGGHQTLVQPAIKCRGREYLRIIYGPEYNLGDRLSLLKKRVVGRKRALALTEFALGVESLERFVRHEPLWRVHECVFGVLALESQPIDPRL
jgi:protein phosphatase